MTHIEKIHLLPTILFLVCCLMGTSFAGEVKKVQLVVPGCL